MSRTEPAAQDRAAAAVAWFEEGGLLAQALPGWEPRAEQATMAGEVARALDWGATLLVEAGTGTGKTLAYLAPAVASGQKVVISTGTKTLQQQLVEKDIPLLQDLGAVPFRAALLKGRSNYLCLLRLEGRRRSASLFDDEEELLARVQRWSRETDTGDRAELEGLPDDAPLWRDVGSTSETCVGSPCPYFEACFVNRARRRAQAADIVVVNHHLFFADLAVRDQWEIDLLPRPDAIIFDEAHQLEDVVCGFFGATVSSAGLQALARDADAAGERLGAGKAMTAATGRLRENARRFFRVFETFSTGRSRLDVDNVPFDAEGCYLDLDNSLDRVGTAVRRLSEADDSLVGLPRRFQEVREQLAAVIDVGANGHVYWVERRGRYTSLSVSPIDAAPLLRDRLFGQPRALVFTSATMATGAAEDDGFAYFRERLGVHGDVDELALPAGFDYREQALLYLPAGMPEPRDPDFVAAAADEMDRLLTVTEGRAFLLFTSYRNLHAAHALLRDRLPFPLLVQGDAPRDELLRRFREDTHSVLFATASFWEGVDVAGESLSCVVIDKLPFGAPDDPVLEARLEALQARGANPFRDYQVPAAVLALRQGFGRLIRSRRDRGVVAILDPRIRTRGYGHRFLSALPDCDRTTDFGRVENWAAEHLSR